MPNTMTPTMPILVESPSVISLYFRLAVLTVLVGVLAMIAGVVGSLLKDYFVNLHRKWLNYLE
jgi:hypothetical protein